MRRCACAQVLRVEAGHDDQPRQHRVADQTDVCQLLPCGDEGLLHQLLRFRDVVGEAVREAVDRRRVTIEQVAEGALVARDTPGDQLDVGVHVCTSTYVVSRNRRNLTSGPEIVFEDGERGPPRGRDDPLDGLTAPGTTTPRCRAPPTPGAFTE